VAPLIINKIKAKIATAGLIWHFLLSIDFYFSSMSLPILLIIIFVIGWTSGASFMYVLAKKS
jgi:hypothetical protein